MLLEHLLELLIGDQGGVAGVRGVGLLLQLVQHPHCILWVTGSRLRDFEETSRWIDERLSLFSRTSNIESFSARTTSTRDASYLIIHEGGPVLHLFGMGHVGAVQPSGFLGQQLSGRRRSFRQVVGFDGLLECRLTASRENMQSIEAE